MTILNGPVVFIDDEVNELGKAAHDMRLSIEADGRPVAAFSSIPDERALAHWQSLSFLVLDWDLSPGSYGALGASMLSEHQRSELFEFLDRFMQTIFCPVFIVSAEDLEDIERQLQEDGRFGEEQLDTRIRIFGKSAVASDLIENLESWVDGNLALSVLKVWENEYDRAKNRLFIDFNNLDRMWPRYVWQMALTDKIEPSYELAATLTANLLHRIDLVKFDTDTMLAEAEASLDSASTRKVFNGRTVIPGDRLHDNVIMPGDIFTDPDDVEKVWLNLTPACHTVPGRVKEGEFLRLYAVPGRPQAFPSKSKFTELVRDSPNSFIVHVLHNDSAYSFNLKAAEFLAWEEVKSLRVGRLLPPYITRAQQANAMFMQVEGIPRVSFEMYKSDT